jgi:hypothetical protein
MSHPIVLLQGALVAALLADAELAALVGTRVFDAPPKGATAPYVAIARHDLLAHDGDGTPGYEHRLALHAWAAEPSRKAALAIAERVLAVALGGDLSGDLTVTTRIHERTDTAIDLDTGQARAALALKFFTEPNE